MYLRNSWYVAAWSREVSHSLMARRILDEAIVLFRRQDGTPVALEDACPHRKLPLSMGRLRGDVLECGYHGLQFDCSGNCVAAPTQGRVPPRTRVRAYRVIERWALLWVWMGDPDRADESLMYCVEDYATPGWGCTEGGTLEFACNYLYITDNLLDPSHVAWVHRTSFAAPGTDSAPLDTRPIEDGVVVSRWIMDEPVPPYYAPFVKFAGNCDRLQHYEVRTPSIAINRSIFTPAGTGGEGRRLDDSAFVMTSYNFMTPIDDNNTKYYWFQQRNTDPDDESISARLNEGALLAFEEDRRVLEAVHRGMANKRTRNIDLGIDAGPLHFRRMLETRVRAEQDLSGSNV